ncbi:hypothetical protein C1885_06005 [Pseudomonas sp. GW531-R1]|jgi:hypothetical protein|nr:hypothetical protein C1885_06005 [Pseudomonas sp. GW531-R1]
MCDYFAALSCFSSWANRRRADPKLVEDAERAFRCSQKTGEQDSEERQVTVSRRGRPELNTTNPVASVISLLSLNRPQWVDDIVYGSVATAGGTSKGKLNVKPGCVLAALHLKDVSAGAIRTADMSLRTAQAIAKAARHAAHGIDFYLVRHPAIRTRLALE